VSARWASAVAGLLLWLPASSALAANVLPKTHAAVLDSVAHMVASDLLRGVVLPPGRPVRVTAPIQGDTLGFFEQAIVERLRQGGTEVRLLPSSRATAELGMPVDDVSSPRDPRGDSTDLQLHLAVRSAGVSYVRALRKFPLGIRGYQRLAAMRVSASLVDLSNHEVLWAKSASGSCMDEVRTGDLSYAQSGSGGLNPGIPRTGGGPRILEPLIVVGVVTGLVVLFYSNRN
jgi:hypothetical protein